MVVTTLVILAVFLILAFFRASITSWLLALMVIVPVMAIQTQISGTTLQVVYLALFLFVVFFGIPPLRRAVISAPILKIFRKVLPQISATEQEAIDAGTVWWDGELFSGHPD
jgi:acyl-CoA dehydrogenase